MLVMNVFPAECGPELPTDLDKLETESCCSVSFLFLLYSDNDVCDLNLFSVLAFFLCVLSSSIPIPCSVFSKCPCLWF